jgi:predicted DsbA family dithiol-disulfide isomerase
MARELRNRELLIEAWSDVACPWCYIGKRRLEAALAQFAERERVRVVWRSFQLDPSAPSERDPAESQVERLAQKYGTSLAQAEAMVERVVQTASEEGLPFNYAIMRSGNTFLLHRLLHLAGERAMQDAVKERFLRAYFCEGRAVGRPEVAAELAIDGGLDPDEVHGLLASDLYEEAVRSDQREARELGVSGVPFFLLNRRYAVSGAQPRELLLEALRRTWNEAVDEASAPEEGSSCGPEGCPT